MLFIIYCSLQSTLGFFWAQWRKNGVLDTAIHTSRFNSIPFDYIVNNFASLRQRESSELHHECKCAEPVDGAVIHNVYNSQTAISNCACARHKITNAVFPAGKKKQIPLADLIEWFPPAASPFPRHSCRFASLAVGNIFTQQQNIILNHSIFLHLKPLHSAKQQSLRRYAR